MWLLPLFPRVAAFATHTFYKTTVTGGTIPTEGPLVLVGNHPNSLLDPLFLVSVARRPVRFLAKAPLFSNPWTSWAVNAVGAIPVYRPKDNPALVRQNASMFRAAHEALLSGDAVGIFPEGISHDGPALVPVRTGAARIALGARSRLGREFPIVPVGLFLRNKEEFRSEAHVLVGDAVAWRDIAGAEDDPGAVKELTARIDESLRGVTLNLDDWEDASLITAAEEIYVAEHGLEPGNRSQVERWRLAAGILSDARRAGDAEAVRLAHEVRRHEDALNLLGLRPRDLNAETDLRSAAGWSARGVALPVAIVVAITGALLFWVPYRLTATVVGSSGADENFRASAKLVAGAALFLAWIGILAALVWRVGGWKAGAVALVLLPALAVATLGLLERSSEAWRDVRRFFLLRSSARTLDGLRSRQRDLARRMKRLRDEAAPASR
ncbi:MAG TPA: lysophospholipid acyltransferase family protein [Gemmatimonadaceae bacterium]|nr:lysophospholipid acyltransferase family protein [Gemmatimonadaceae bacterium]